VRISVKSLVCFAALSVCSTLFAASIPVSGSMNFLGGANGTFAISLADGPTGPSLSSVTINLAPGLFFDTASGGPGYLTWLDLTPLTGGAATGYSGSTPNTAAGRDGATSLTLNFTNFTPGKTFTFLVDVDQTVTVPSCPTPTLACLASQVAARTNGSIVDLNEFAGSQATFHFTGVDIVPISLPLTFTGGSGLVQAQAFATIIDAVPEPSTYAMIGAGLAFLGLRLRRRS